MEGGTTHVDSLFYTRSSSNTYHIIRPDQDTAACGYLDTPRTPDGQLDTRKLHIFTGFDAKPPHKWCQHCREEIDQ